MVGSVLLPGCDAETGSARCQSSEVSMPATERRCAVRTKPAVESGAG